jgi:hypothetical protein
LKRLKGKNLSPITYERKLYKINNGGVTATLRRYWPRNSSFVCNQSMLGCLRRILKAEFSMEIDMDNAQPQLLSGMCPDAAFLHDYCANRKACLLEVATAAGVDRGAANKLFITLVFGSSINTWKEDYNVANDVSLPKFAYDFETGVRTCESKFNADPKKLHVWACAPDKKTSFQAALEKLCFCSLAPRP